MAEYIEREAAYKDFEKCNSENPKWTPSRVKTLMTRQKAANVAPVVHGQWYMLDDCANAGLYCSACGRRVHHEEFAYKKLKSKYCPHCGARMDREGTAHDESERDFQTLCRRLGRGRGYQDRRQT